MAMLCAHDPFPRPTTLKTKGLEPREVKASRWPPPSPHASTWLLSGLKPGPAQGSPLGFRPG